MLPLAILTLIAGRPDDAAGDVFEFEPGDVVETFDSGTGRFEVHYTRAGKNAVPAADADADGVPDHVQDVAAIYDDVLDTYLAMGFRAPLDDGDGVFDVYLVDTDFSADGHFQSETCDGDNRCSGYMVQENDFAGFPYPSVDYANRLLASHEFFHAVQAAYDADQGSIIAEGTAVWASEHYDSGLDDLELFASDFLDNADRGLTGDGGGPVDPFTYGSAVFWEFLSQRHGVDVIRSLWEACDDGSDAHWTDRIDDVVTAAGGTGFADDLQAFALAALSLGPRADPAKGFSDAAALPAPVLRNEDEPFSRASFVLFPASYVTFSIQASGPVRAAIAGETGDARLALVPLFADAAGDPLGDGALDVTDDTGGHVAVQIVNGSLTDAVRPRVCIGAPADVDACLAQDEEPPPIGVNPVAPEGCSCGAAAQPELPAALAFLWLLSSAAPQSRARRAQNRSST